MEPHIFYLILFLPRERLTSPCIPLPLATSPCRTDGGSFRERSCSWPTVSSSPAFYRTYPRRNSAGRSPFTEAFLLPCRWGGRRPSTASSPTRATTPERVLFLSVSPSCGGIQGESKAPRQKSSASFFLIRFLFSWCAPPPFGCVDAQRRTMSSIAFDCRSRVVRLAHRFWYKLSKLSQRFVPCESRFFFCLPFCSPSSISSLSVGVYRDVSQNTEVLIVAHRRGIIPAGSCSCCGSYSHRGSRYQVYLLKIELISLTGRLLFCRIRKLLTLKRKRIHSFFAGVANKERCGRFV